MASKLLTLSILLLLFYKVNSETVFERSYEYLMSFGKNLAPSFMSFFDCVSADDVWGCAKDKVGKILDGWDREVQRERRIWQEAADAEVASKGRSMNEAPSQIGREIEGSLNSIVEFVNSRMSRNLEGKKHGGGGIDSITISTGTGDKKKIKKKKPKPPKIHLLHPVMLKMQKKQQKGRDGRVQSWVIGDPTIADNDPTIPESDADLTLLDEEDSRTLERSDFDDVATENNYDLVRKGIAPVNASARRGRDLISELWSIGGEALDAVAEHALENDNLENGVADKSSVPEQRGKKKKKKKAILKLLILGAVLKAKIGTLLQILSFKLQVKFFIIALIGLGINLARLWIDIKNKHNQQPQKVIYYEHAQHQHHYDHEDEHEHGWGPWSRSMDPEEDIEVDLDVQNTPYRGHERISQFNPLLTKF